MKVGEAITYRFRDELRIVRKERNFFMSYVPSTDSFYYLEEELFDVLMSTLEGELSNLIDDFAERCDGGVEGASDLIRCGQANLVAMRMLDDSMCRDSWQGVEKSC